VAAQEYTLTRGGDVVTTSSQATVDYLLTQGWVVGASTGLPAGPASPQALEDRVYALEQDALYSHDLIINTDLRVWDTPTEPRGFGGFWSSGTRTQSRDMDIFRTGTSSWKVALGASSFHRAGTQRFTVRPQDVITCTWTTRSSTNKGKFDAMLMTSDGLNDPNFFGVDVNQQGGATMLQTVAGEWQTWTQSWVVPRGHRQARIYVTSQSTDGTAIDIWLDSISVKAGAEAAVDLMPGWIAPTLTAPFVNYGATWETVGYKKVAGVVYLRGLLNTTGAAGGSATIFTLPQGYRTSGDQHIIVATGVSPWSTLINVMASGVVRINQPIGAGQWLSLANVSFPADA
jgi:hypothetical protein